MNQGVEQALGADGFRSLLAVKRGDVLSALGETVASFSTGGRVGDEDLAQASHDEFVSLRLNGIDFQMLKLVEAALGRLDRGEYGACQRCDAPIAPKRLAAVPWALYCVRCQERAGDSRYIDPIAFKLDADDDDST